MAIAANARLIPQGGFKALAQRNPHIFNRMVIINMQIALGRNRQVSISECLDN